MEQLKKRLLLTEKLLNVILGFVLLFVVVLVYWQVAHYDVLQERDGNYSIDKTQYKKGETIHIRLNVCKNKEISESIKGRFVDGVIFSVPENGSNFEVGCYDTVITSVKIPDSLPLGKYTYIENISYEVNPLRTIEYIFKTPEFEVVE